MGSHSSSLPCNTKLTPSRPLRTIRQALGSIEEIDITEWNGTNSSVARDIERLDLILIHIQGIKGVMGEDEFM